MLDGAGNAAGNEQRGTNRDASLSNLALVLNVAEVYRSTAASDRAAKSIGEIVEKFEILLRPDARAACDDNARTLEVDVRMAADDFEDFDGNLDAVQPRLMADDFAGPAGNFFERLHDALAHGRHLRPVAGVDDCRDDVAAERRTDLKEDVIESLLRLRVRILADLEIGAVGGEAAAQFGGHGRREVAPHVRRAKYHNLRRTFLDHGNERMAIRLTAENLESRIFDEVDLVGASFKKRLRERLDAIAHQNRCQRNAKPVRKFTSLAEEFARDVAQNSVFLFGEYPDFALGSICRHIFLFH